MKSFGKPIGDVLIRRPYVQLQTFLDATQPKGRRYYWKSEYLSRVDPALCERIIAYASRIPSPNSAIILFQIAGALNGLSEDYSSTGNRAACYVVNLTSSWLRAEDDPANITWAREAWADVRSFSTGGNYINFLSADEGPERIASALGKNLQRLTEVKSRWDPQNVFRTNRNFKPQ